MLNGSCCCAARCGIPNGDSETPVFWSPQNFLCEHLYNQLYNTVRPRSVNNVPLEETAAFNPPLPSNLRHGKGQGRTSWDC
ncbi:hypothetical protein WJX77_012288 [Trebouxia sp. C0004]